MDDPTNLLSFPKWLRSVLERVFTAELERQGHSDLEFVFLRPTDEPDTHHDWRELNE